MTLAAWLNSESEVEVGLGPLEAQPYALLFLQVVHGRVIGECEGAILLDPSAGLDTLYNLQREKDATAVPLVLGSWSATVFATWFTAGIGSRAEVHTADAWCSCSREVQLHLSHATTAT